MSLDMVYSIGSTCWDASPPRAGSMVKLSAIELQSSVPTICWTRLIVVVGRRRISSLSLAY